MTFDQLKEFLKRFLTGKATDEDLQLVEKWFLHTERKPYELNDAKREEIGARLLPRLEAIAFPKKTYPPVIFTRPLLRIAAVFLILFSAGAVTYHFRYPLLDKIDPIPNRTVIAGNYEIRSVLLPDGSRAILRNGSRISFPEQYRGSERIVNMEGEVYFDIHKDPNRVFKVHSPQMAVRVLGTSFVVADSPASVNAVVNVLTGKIGLTHEEEDLGELQAGRELTYDRKTGRASWRYSDSSQVTAWIHKTFVFNETPLESVFAAMESKFGVRFLIRKDKSGKIKLFTGMFSEGDSLENMLMELSMSTGLHYSTISNNAIEIHYP